MEEAHQPPSQPSLYLFRKMQLLHQTLVSTALQVEWTKVVMGARMHHQASISLRTIRHYSPGTDLQEVSAIW